MKAAKNFQWGGKNKDGADDRRTFKVGDDIPSDVAKDLDDDSFFLEKIPKKDLTRDQLLVLAGKDKVVEEDEEEEEIDETEFREGMSAVGTKRELASWAREMFDVTVDENLSRQEMEDFIFDSQFGTDDAEAEDEE